MGHLLKKGICRTNLITSTTQDISRLISKWALHERQQQFIRMPSVLCPWAVENTGGVICPCDTGWFRLWQIIRCFISFLASEREVVTHYQLSNLSRSYCKHILRAMYILTNFIYIILQVCFRIGKLTCQFWWCSRQVLSWDTKEVGWIELWD